jgi:hypothetical protein
MKYILKYIIDFSLLIYSVNSIKVNKMTKKEILSLDLKQYNGTEECPYYGYKSSFLTDNYPSKCRYTFYCIDDDNCQFDKNPDSPFFEFIDNEGNVHKYIKDFKDYNCKVDSDCLSNKCQYNICVNDGSSLFTECSDNYIVNEFNEFQQEMKCGKLDGVKCTDSSECAGGCSDICESHYEFYSINNEKKSNNEIQSNIKINKRSLDNFEFEFEMFFSIVYCLSFYSFGCFCCFCCFCCAPCRTKNKKPKNPIRYYNGNKIELNPEVFINICDEDEKDILSKKYQIKQGYLTVFEDKIRILRSFKEMNLPTKETKIFIKRDDMLKSSFDTIINLSLKEMKNTLRISYIGEKGIDAGGLLKDFFYQLSKEIGNPNYSLLQYSSGNSYELEINPQSSLDNPLYLKYFKFIGRLMGLAIFNKQYFPLSFTLLFYKRLLGKEPEFSDLKFVDSQIYKNLKWLKENNNAKDLCLTFSIEEVDCFDNHKNVELKEGGSNIEVTDENKNEYIDLVLKYKFNNDKDEEQFNALKEGFFEIIPHEICDILNEFDLKFLISGVNLIDIEDWERNTAYQGYTVKDPTIINFWKCVKEFSNEQRTQLLIFATGSSQVPITGFKDLQNNSNNLEPFTLKNTGNVDDLPISHTCFNRIDLPPYTSCEQLKEKLLRAITEGVTDFQRE